jgi:hypothetical protein
MQDNKVHEHLPYVPHMILLISVISRFPLMFDHTKAATPTFLTLYSLTFDDGAWSINSQLAVATLRLSVRIGVGILGLYIRL